MAFYQEKQSGFHQTLANQGKLGAYYTDLSHCKSLQGAFKFGKSTLCLEPSIGDGSAIKEVLGKQKEDGKYIFGIELNSDTYASIKDDEEFEAVLNADALHGTKISNNVFSFCFSNPPYGDGERDAHGKTKRLELSFVERIFTLMRKGGILCLVVPEYVLKEEGFQKGLIGRFEMLHVYRFREPEYSKFKQCVFIGICRNTYGWMPAWIDAFNTSLRDMKALPDVWEEDVIEVPESVTESVHQFTTMAFDPAFHLKNLSKNRPARQFEEKVAAQELFGMKESHPPIKLKKNLLYLLAVSGEGQGEVGDADEGTLHMQRGTAKRVSNSEFVKKNGETVEVVTTSTQICMTIVEADGTVTKLQ